MSQEIHVVLLRFVLIWLALHNAVRVGVKEDGSQNVLLHMRNSTRAEASLKSAEAVEALSAGMSVDEFQLVKQIKHWSLSVKGNNLAQQYGSKTGDTGLLPEGNNDFESGQRLSAGTFGEAWLATPTDPELWPGAEHVVLKFFYTLGSGRRIRYRTYAEALNLKGEILLTMDEEDSACRTVQLLVHNAKRQGRSAKDHICQCLASRIKGQFANSRAYIVQEYGGETLEHLVQTNRSSVTKRFHARKVVSQLLSVVHFLGKAHPKKIFLHHDLKPANIVYQIIDNQIQIKVIDWGALLVIDKEGRKIDDGCITSEDWAPYDYFKPCYDSGCPQSFDVFATGLIYAYLLLDGWMGWTDRGNRIASLCVDMKRRAEVKGLSFLNEDWFFVDYLSRPECRRPSPRKAREHCTWNHSCAESEEDAHCR